MSQLIRLVYASRSTLTYGTQRHGLSPDVSRILAKSRKNNAQRQIVGGLLFGDGCFLQCLEGDKEAVETLYRKIEADRRHRDVKVLLKRKIIQRSFGAWSMKYVPGERALGELLRAWGATRFDPYGLSADRLEVAVDFMQHASDAVDTLPGAFDDGAAPAKRYESADSIVSRLKPSIDAESSGARPRVAARRGRLRFGVVTAVILALAAAAAAYRWFV